MSSKKNLLRRTLHGKHFCYETNIYPFKETLEDLFGCKCDELHKYLGNFAKFDRENDQATFAHKVYYSNFKRLIYPIYYKFQKEFISKIIEEPYFFQIIPTFRIGLPSNKFVGTYHKDSEYNHKEYEINFNLGISGYKGNTALKAETMPGSNEFIFLECPYGQIFSFDHIDCIHGSDLNETNETLVSIDFRIALKNLYYESDACSINTKTRFIPGEYFSLEELNNNF